LLSDGDLSAGRVTVVGTVRVDVTLTGIVTLVTSPSPGIVVNVVTALVIVVVEAGVVDADWVIVTGEQVPELKGARVE
jgi:hypothetical protein